MDDEKSEVKLDETDIRYLRQVIERSSSKGVLVFIAILLLVLTVGIGYLCFNTYRETNATETIDSVKRVLVVTIESDLSDSNRSSTTQVKNAFADGGMIRIKSSNDGFDYSLGSAYKQYGATDASGSFWSLGAVLNYIASRGWTFVQAPTTGLSDYYYFVK